MTDSNDEIKQKFDDNLRQRGGNNRSGKSKSQINAEYFQALEQWLNDVRSYRYSCNFFAGLPYTMMAQQMNGFTPQINNFVPPIPPINQGFSMFTFPQQQQTQPERGVEYTIPPLWKRFIAELLDFILLFIMKMVITFIAVDFFDFFDLIDLDKFDSIKQDQMDYKIALEVASKIAFLEIVHRIIVCLYEGIFLRKGIENQIGGSTPGKTVMGIKVVLCNSIQQIENHPNVVKVVPASDLGFGWSFARAFLKNFFVVFLFPISFPYFFNKFNRTTYDIWCHSVVVEDRVQSNRNR